MTETRIVIVPIGGNAFITHRGNSTSPEVVSDSGLGNWVDPLSICSVFFKLSQPETFYVSLRLKVVPSGKSVIRVSLGAVQSYETTIEGAESYIQNIGMFFTDLPGYVQLDIQGISKTGSFFGDISEVILNDINGNVLHIIHPEHFYFGRRGPSVHLNYDTEVKEPIEYFYNEVRVPVEQDVVGAFFMATGFSEGYFGMQVNSSSERRILFSVWSDYGTDNPEDIPEDYRVVLLRKGPNVIVNDFGNEGSGKQSFLRYEWKAEATYKFLIFGCPIDSENTKYTAWFCPPELNSWQLIASFRKPKISSYLKSFHSFSENFIPETGHVERKVLFGNQWIRNADGIWKEVLKATFTGDDTSKNGRDDFAGGVSEENGMFFLRHCGFFDDKVETNVHFNRLPTHTPPDIDLENLP